MTVMRDEHFPWCKRQALKDTDAGDLTNAAVSAWRSISESIQALTTRHSMDCLGSR